MLGAGEELFMFEKEFFMLTKKYFEMEKVGERALEMTTEIDELNKKYVNSMKNKLYIEYVNTRIDWFLVMITRKERWEDSDL